MLKKIILMIVFLLKETLLMLAKNKCKCELLLAEKDVKLTDF